MLLALMLCAAPLVPEAPFPKLGSPPLKLDLPSKSKPMTEDAAVALARPLVEGRPELGRLYRAFTEELQETRGQLHRSLDNPFPAQLFAIGRVTVGSCIESFVRWNQPDVEGGFSTLNVFTTGADGRLLAGFELGTQGGTLSTPTFGANVSVDARGDIRVEQSVAESFEHAPAELFDANEGRRGGWVSRDEIRVFRLLPDCRLDGRPPIVKQLSGNLLDPKTKEELWLRDDGKRVRAVYSAGADKWVPLLVDDFDRDAGTITVRFGKSKPPYPLSWDATHQQLSCRNPDGGIQVFDEQRF